MATKAVRIREHLYEEIERLAKAERRSLIAQLEVLLEQALATESGEHGFPRIGEATDKPRVEVDELPNLKASVRVIPADPHFKPDPKKPKPPREGRKR